MHLRFLKIWVLPLLILALFGRVCAQEVLISDAGIPSRSMPAPQRGAGAIGTLRTTTLTLPFFDDFSYDSLSPDTARWGIHPLDGHRPALSNAKGHNLPSKGVATFDGATFSGVKYDATFGSGLRDTLASKPIDISGFGPADSLLLSFFVQRGGIGESPEATDSLVVLFDTTGNFDYAQVWALKGTGTSENAFQLYFISLSQANYFHNAFRFKFESYGSLNGELDQFHLDYVVLDAQRSRLNTQFNDVSPTRFAQSPLGEYTAVPRKQYRRQGAMSTTRTLVSNAGDPASSANLSLAIDDPIGGNVFAGTTIVSASLSSLPGFAHDTVNASAFSNQGGNWGQYGGIRLTASKSSPADLHPENDVMHTTYRVDSILAMDDGVSDIGYGLTNARAFCQEYHIDQPDTMVAVWIHFAPTMHFNSSINQSTDLEGKGFRLVVWDTLEVDSSLIETSGGMNVNYGSSLNEYVRYRLINAVIVPTTFWIGLRQVDGMAIGMGLDRNDTGRRIYYENSTAEFQLSTNRGTLMMRPEFTIPDTYVATDDPVISNPLEMTMAPNPVRGAEIGLRFAHPEQLRSVNVELYDLQGRRLQAWEQRSGLRDLTLDLQQKPASGIYLLRVRGVDAAGKSHFATERLIIGQ